MFSSRNILNKPQKSQFDLKSDYGNICVIRGCSFLIRRIITINMLVSWCVVIVFLLSGLPAAVRGPWSQWRNNGS